MEWIWNYVLCSALMSLMSVIWFLNKRKSYSSKLPPGPKGWPFIGNIFDLGDLPHRSLAAVKQEYGPVVLLNLGSIKTMVVQSAGAAEELFKNHDFSFSDRSIVHTMRSHDYHKNSMLLSPCNIYWRTLKRICAVELFSNKKINETMLVRQKCVDEMLLEIEKGTRKDASNGIEVTHFVFSAIFNTMGNLILSQNLVDPCSEIASQFYMAMSGFTECLSCPNVSDIFPWLSKLDLQGLRRKMDRDMGKAIEIVSGFVTERVKQRHQNEGISSGLKKDFLDVVLDFKGTGKDEPAKLSEYQVTIFLMDIFFAATESISTSTEWAMSELLQNYEAMIKIKAELDRVVGANKKVEETDIDNLHYLQATVKETLRLHPPAPLLVPRKAIQDTDFMGYSIPKGTHVFVNAWAIGRDEESWEDALCFKPERFLDSDIGYKGQHFELIPFGSGRRMCPGLPLAHYMLSLVLGTLLHHFEWELCEGETTVDMTETMGTTVRKLQPLKAKPKLKKT